MDSLGTRERDESGFGLLASMLVLMIVGVLGTALINVTLTDLAVSSNFQAKTAAFYAADSGVQQTIVDLAVDPNWASALLVGGSFNPSPDSLTINGHTVAFAKDKKTGEIALGYYALGSAGSIGNASYRREIQLPLPPVQIEGPSAWLTFPIRVTGERGATDPSTSVIGVDVMVRVNPGSGPWSYALAAGDGWGPEALADDQGGLRVHGSLRIFGDQANPPTVRWKGNASVVNHYGGLDDASRFGADAAKLPPLDTAIVNGEVVETLHAVVNVENADFQFLDYGSWGQPDVSGNAVQETLDGVYVDGNMSMDGYGGVYGEKSGAFHEDSIDFPELSDPYVDPISGASYSNHVAFLDANSVTLQYETISQDTPAFDNSDPEGNRIAWDPSTGTLTVEGIIKCPGDLIIEYTANQQNAIFYEGTGTIYARDKMRVGSDLLPSGDYIDADSLGLVAGAGLEIVAKANGEAPRIMAAAYANAVEIDAGVHLAGSLVAGEVEFHGSVGTIAHVPKLSLSPPPGMPGSGGGISTIMEIFIRDWYEQR